MCVWVCWYVGGFFGVVVGLWVSECLRACVRENVPSCVICVHARIREQTSKQTQTRKNQHTHERTHHLAIVPEVASQAQDHVTILEGHELHVTGDACIHTFIPYSYIRVRWHVTWTCTPHSNSTRTYVNACVVHECTMLDTCTHEKHSQANTCTRVLETARHKFPDTSDTGGRRYRQKSFVVLQNFLLLDDS